MSAGRCFKKIVYLFHIHSLNGNIQNLVHHWDQKLCLILTGNTNDRKCHNHCASNTYIKYQFKHVLLMATEQNESVKCVYLYIKDDTEATKVNSFFIFIPAHSQPKPHLTSLCCPKVPTGKVKVMCMCSHCYTRQTVLPNIPTSCTRYCTQMP